MTRPSRRAFLVQGAAGAAWVVLWREGTANAAAESISVTGAVRSSSGQPLPGVFVSNGYRLVATDAAGRYSIDVDVERYPFVFVNAPAGYKPHRAFYTRLEPAASAGADFVLALAPERTGRRLRLAHVTDSHVGVVDKPHFASTLDLAADYRAIVADCRPDLIVHTGDFTDNGRRADMAAYLRDAVHPLTTPVATVYGNHDADEDRTLAGGNADAANNAIYQAVMGPDQYAFDWGEYHIVVCGMYWVGRPARLPRLTAWLAADLALQPPGRRIIVLTHDKPRLHDALTTEYGPTLGELCRTPGVFLTLFGHHHLTCAFRHEGVTAVCIPTVSVGAIDTSPRGYGVISIEGSQVDVEIRPLSTCPPRAVATIRRGASLPSLKLKGAWTHDVGTSLHRAAPIACDGQVMVSLGDRRPLDRVGVIALDCASGQQRWHWQSDATVKNSVVLAGADAPHLADRVFAVEVNGRLACLDARSGSVRWRVDVPFYPDRYFYVTPVVTPKAVYLTQHTGSYAFDPSSGRLLWQTGQHWDENRSAVYYSPARIDGALVHLVTTMLGYHGVAAISENDGRTIWTRRLDLLPASYPSRFFQSHWPSPQLAGRHIVVPGLADRLALVDADTGDLVWHEPVLHDEGPRYGPVPSFYHVTFEHAQGLLVREQTIYGTTSNGRLYAIDLSTGRRLWRWASDRVPLLDCQPYYRGKGNGLTTPAWRDGLLYFGGADGWLYALDAASGQLAGEHDLGTPITAPPLATSEGLTVAGYDGRVRHFEWV